MKKIEINTARYSEDVERIQKILANKGYEATLIECEKLWDTYSESMEAGWIILPKSDEDVFESISCYIKNL
jgi:predicted metal-dependent peptidase